MIGTILTRAFSRAGGTFIGTLAPITANSEDPTRLLQIIPEISWEDGSLNLGATPGGILEYATVFTENAEIATASGLFLGLVAPRLASTFWKSAVNNNINKLRATGLTVRAVGSALLAIPAGLTSGTMANGILSAFGHVSAKNSFDFDEIVDAADLDRVRLSDFYIFESPLSGSAWSDTYEAVDTSLLGGVMEMSGQIGHTTLKTITEVANSPIDWQTPVTVAGGLAPLAALLISMYYCYSYLVGGDLKTDTEKAIQDQQRRKQPALSA